MIPGIYSRRPFESSAISGSNWKAVVRVAPVHAFSLGLIEIEPNTIRCLLERLEEILCMF